MKFVNSTPIRTLKFSVCSFRQLQPPLLQQQHHLQHHLDLPICFYQPKTTPNGHVLCALQRPSRRDAKFTGSPMHPNFIFLKSSQLNDRKWPRRTGRFFFSWLSWCAIWMKFTIKQFHAVSSSCLLCTQRKRHTQAARRIFCLGFRTSLVGVLLVHSNFGTFILLLAYDNMNPNQRRG